MQRNGSRVDDKRQKKRESVLKEIGGKSREQRQMF